MLMVMDWIGFFNFCRGIVAIWIDPRGCDFLAKGVHKFSELVGLTDNIGGHTVERNTIRWDLIGIELVHIIQRIQIICDPCAHIIQYTQKLGHIGVQVRTNQRIRR
jgi:hypothetical protein